MNNQDIHEIQVTNGKAIGSVLIGIVSILGFILLERGTVLSLAGLFLGLIGLKETKQFNQTGGKLAIAGILFNCFGVVTLFL